MSAAPWLLRRPAVDTETNRCPWVEGWCSTTSATAGETVTLHVSADPPSQVLVEVFRSGYEGGAGGRQVAEFGPLHATTQPVPPVGPERLRVCAWEPTVEFTIPADWRSGVHLIRLTALDTGIDSYAIFIVTDRRSADLIVQCSDLTWQAYNGWPGHSSLYDDGHRRWSFGRDVCVAFDRPYGKYWQIVDAPLSCGSGEWLLWEYPMAYWLEEEGYDVTYVSNIDVHDGSAGLGRAPAFLSVGHDEYYTKSMFEQLSDAVVTGTSIGFFGANTCSALVGLDAASNRPNRAMRRLDRFGPPRPIDDELFPELRDLPGAMPSESLLIGARTSDPATGRGDWICTAPDHWVYEGTGMQRGDAVPGLVGWEYHGDPAEIEGLEVVSEGPTTHPRGAGRYTATVYEGPSGTTVFNAATIWWADGLAEPPGYVRPNQFTTLAGTDARVQRITRNVVDRLIETGARR